MTIVTDTSLAGLGDRVRERRTQLGMSQARLAEPDFSDSYISLIESGKRDPSPAVIRALARKLGCSATYLECGVGEEALADLKTGVRQANTALAAGRTDEALMRFTELLDAYGVDAFPQLYREIQRGHAMALESAGRLDEAVAELERIAMSVRGLDWDEWATVQIGLCRCHRKRDDLAACVAAGEEALTTLQAVGEGSADAAIRVGVSLLDAYLEGGDVLATRQLAARLVRAADEGGSPKVRIAAYRQAAIAAEVQGDYDSGVRLAERALAVLSEDDDFRAIGWLRVEYASLLLRARPGAADQARTLLLAHEREMAVTASDEGDLADCVIELARAEIALGRPEEAEKQAKRAIELIGPVACRASAQAMSVLGETYVRLGRHEEAIEALTRGAEYLETAGLPREAAQAWFDVAELLRHTGSSERQQAHTYRRALTTIGLRSAGE
ncbi:MAG TPA: tetratricopeptide repeat protein [Chloroflexota bacterium]|jgi:tetratricopeptide (TPR) repeat protein|nr:tetratricopeptide repeat protein [Chloroflexota bacterium]